MNLKVTIAILAFAGIAHAGSYPTLAEFCKKASIDKESADKVDVASHKAVIEQMGKILSPEADCDFIKKHSTEKGWALIDARDPETRKSTGTFEAAVKLVSDHKDLASHQFKKEMLVDKLAKHFEAQGRKPSSVDDLKGNSLMIFCNGPKCYRTPWAGCSLNEMGFKKENLFFVTDGYEGLKKHCFK